MQQRLLEVQEWLQKAQESLLDEVQQSLPAEVQQSVLEALRCGRWEAGWALRFP